MASCLSAYLPVYLHALIEHDVSLHTILGCPIAQTSELFMCFLGSGLAGGLKGCYLFGWILSESRLLWLVSPNCLP